LEIAMTMPVRAALYLRVSTGRQADNDLSIPDQRRQAKGYCASRGWEIVADYVEPGLSATDDRRPEFQRMIDAATTKPPAFDVILVHSFSRFFRDQFQLEFYVRRLAKSGVRLVSITQELGDDPMSNMIRQIMALFDEYQSKENAKHTLRAMKENARQAFWNGALPPIGYRIVEASEQRGHRTKKTLEIDPVQAETVRLIFRLARERSGSSGPMGIKSIATHLNASGIRTRDGGRWGVDAVHKVLTRTTYIGRHRFNTKFWKTRERKPENEIVEMAVPAIVDKDEFEVVQMLVKSRSPAMTPPRVVSGPTLLTGICFCAACGGAMTLRTGKSGLAPPDPLRTERPLSPATSYYTALYRLIISLASAGWRCPLGVVGEWKTASQGISRTGMKARRQKAPPFPPLYACRRPTGQARHDMP
jgi:site-specific DNA recombinase